MRFIPSAAPIPKLEPPTGPDWLHEVKFDGWRIQVHKNEGPSVHDACEYLPDCVIDGELVACDTDGKPMFSHIRGSHPKLCIWCFDLMQFEGKDIRSLPLVERREKLRDLLIATDDDTLRFSEEFRDPVKLLETVGKMGLVSKRRSSAYSSGTKSGWVKVKSAE